MRTLGLGNFCPACQAHSTEEARRSQWPIVGMLIGPANLPWGSPVQPLRSQWDRGAYGKFRPVGLRGRIGR